MGIKIEFDRFKIGMRLRNCTTAFTECSGDYVRVETVGHDWAVVRGEYHGLSLIKPDDGPFELYVEEEDE